MFPHWVLGPIIQCVPGIIVQGLKRLGPEVEHENLSIPRSCTSAAPYSLLKWTNSTISPSNAEHISVILRYSLLCSLFSSRLLFLSPPLFSTSFFPFSSFFITFFFFIPLLSGCHTSLSFFPYFLPLALPFVSVYLNTLCPLSLQFFFLPLPVFTSLSTHHIASQTKCA